ncbi:MAG: alpha-glucan family phosphorylase [Vicinamibacterales bacterium]|nr:alpha-glucan family phosphorylase [Vicinamibacterales bacterium]
MIAYLSMEVGIEPGMPTYAGGLGVLAGDIVRAAADLGLPLVAMTLLHRKGYFRQRLDAAGRQREEATAWNVEAHLEALPARIAVSIHGRQVVVRAWQRRVTGWDGATVPVYFLDTDVEENLPEDRLLSHFLYGGDAAYRLAQEAVLGIGGVRMLRALGYADIRRFHLNEGHSALLVAELMAERLRGEGRTVPAEDDVEAVRQMCVFTTHTPVPAAHDQFPPALVERVLGPTPISEMLHRCCYGGALNMTYLALHFSHYVNGVAMRHGEVSRRMYGGYAIDAITNGVHAATWVSPPVAALFDRRIPGWRRDNFSLRYAVGIPRHEVWDAHVAAKLRLLELVNREQSPPFDPAVLTLGFARRASAYKRADLIVSDPDRLRAVAAAAGRLQIVFAGKAHPRDADGKHLIEMVFRARETLRNEITIAYLEDYDMTMAGVVTAGADVWLNTPHPPLEASGTSGMKAALNGVPSLSVLDGWWLEGHVEGVTGWAIGEDCRESLVQPVDSATHAAALYDALERTVLPLFYAHRDGFVDVMRYAIALNGSFFTAQRMLQEYVIKAYQREGLSGPQPPSPREHQDVSRPAR